MQPDHLHGLGMMARRLKGQGPLPEALGGASLTHGANSTAGAPPRA